MDAVGTGRGPAVGPHMLRAVDTRLVGVHRLVPPGFDLAGFRELKSAAAPSKKAHARHTMEGLVDRAASCEDAF